MLQTILFPVKDVEKAKAVYTALLGTAPGVESPYYVGYDIDGQHIGLVPNGSTNGPACYRHVDDLEKGLAALIEAGASMAQEPKEVGNGRTVASVLDADGNEIGLIQDRH
ncbi:VOC family protein [Kutzneria chonburiensis]|jgi:lactoylglutathione lyase|uniref:VOC family protein n=1 Tax=Kutzneria chonburiensis TaxID=1483604 RepID=A0ABV6MRU5_9PSEU|nr:VOC family protein [Kutzneria chonburiensis]HTI26608.1 VOC family protein [Kutzneria sp.]